MEGLLRLLCVAMLLRRYNMQMSTPESPTYIAAVVEYAADQENNTPQQRLNLRVIEYVNFITHADAVSADIIVFPESTLTDIQLPQTVPDAAERVVPCANSAYNSNAVQSISCAARDSRKYVVINLIGRRSIDNAADLYNMNVVFDRNGEVISTYRKFNLFADENGVKSTDSADVNTFTTDFGVEFGHFIGYDILYQAPAMNLINRGIKNFISPSKWYSNIPFLTALQVQQGWAFANQVNLLAAGANNPAAGNSGSGIYSGRQGNLESYISGTRASQLLVKQISKSPGQNTDTTIQLFPSITPPLKLTRDNALLNDKHYYGALYPNVLEHQSICNGDICCSFTMQLSTTQIASDAVTYSYMFGMHYATWTVDGKPLNAIKACSVYACTDNSDFSTCGHIFEPGTKVQNGFQFGRLEVRGNFLAEDSLILPSTLTTSLTPLNSDYINYAESESFTIHGLRYKNVTLGLRRQQPPILTFGIYGFGGNSASGSVAVMIIVFISVLISLM